MVLAWQRNKVFSSPLQHSFEWSFQACPHPPRCVEVGDTPQTCREATALSYMRSKMRWMLAKLGRSEGSLLQQRRIRL